MNSTIPDTSSVIRFIAQNVTEHLQEDEMEYFLVVYEVGAVIVCLTLSYHIFSFTNLERLIIERKFRWFPISAVFLIGGYCLQGFRKNVMIHKYHQVIQDRFTPYVTVINLLLHPLEMFHYGYISTVFLI